eukprot:1159886-Pelagomonas_calceolata.AAC.7
MTFNYLSITLTCGCCATNFKGHAAGNMSAWSACSVYSSFAGQGRPWELGVGPTSKAEEEEGRGGCRPGECASCCCCSQSAGSEVWGGCAAAGAAAGAEEGRAAPSLSKSSKRFSSMQACTQQGQVVHWRWRNKAGKQVNACAASTPKALERENNSKYTAQTLEKGPQVTSIQFNCTITNAVSVPPS